MKRSWFIEKSSLLRHYIAEPVEGGGSSEVFRRCYSPERRVPYTVVYENVDHDVPADLCTCRVYWNEGRGALKRTVHHYYWTDAPWIEFIAWGV